MAGETNGAVTEKQDDSRIRVGQKDVMSTPGLVLPHPQQGPAGNGPYHAGSLLASAWVPHLVGERQGEAEG